MCICISFHSNISKFFSGIEKVSSPSYQRRAIAERRIPGGRGGGLGPHRQLTVHVKSLSTLLHTIVCLSTYAYTYNMIGANSIMVSPLLPIRLSVCILLCSLAHNLFTLLRSQCHQTDRYRSSHANCLLFLYCRATTLPQVQAH